MDRLLHYDITEKLGEGKNGESYLAYDTGFQRAVVLKFLVCPHVTEKAWQNWHDSQMSLLTKIDDDRVALYYAREEAEGKNFIIREYVEGFPLTHYISESHLSSKELIQLALDIASVIELLHNKGVVHGNLTPENLLITKDKKIKLVDFCLNIKLESFNDIEDLFPLFPLSPEQLRGEEATTSSDLYSFGVLLYFLGTGEMPHTGKSIVHLLEAKETGELSWKSEKGYKVSGMLRLLIGKLMSPDPIDRFISASDLCLTLKEISIYPPEKMGLIGKPESKWSARQLMILAVLVALLLIFWTIVSSIRF